MNYKCPYCKKEIEELGYKQNTLILFSLSLDKDNQIQFEEIDRNADDEGVYFCPNCTEELAFNEEKAKELLKKIGR